MCLEVIAVAGTPEKVSAQRLSTLSGLCVRKANRPVKGALHFSLEPGCSCSLLDASADWTQPTWRFSSDVLEGLAKAVATLADEAGGLQFQAIWMGEEPETEGQAPLKELLRDIRANRIKNKHVYRVGRFARASAAKTRR